MDKISSDILEQQFGESSLQVIHQNEHERIITTSVKDTHKILEISWVRFKNTDSYPDIQEQVHAGTSIGKAFRAQNIPFNRSVIATGKVIPPPIAQKLFQSQADITLVEVSLYVGSDQLHYADITELYAFEVDWPYTSTQDIQVLHKYSGAVANRLASL